MKIFFLAVMFTAVFGCAYSQELYVHTEPASNMATHSLGIRLENEGFFNPVYKTRTSVEVMYGASRNWMLHTTVYGSDYHTANQHFEGISAYAKYRFLAIDTVQRHFRGAVFAKIAGINNPVQYQEIALEGDNSGIEGGVVFTQLLHKLALSTLACYLRGFNNWGDNAIPSVNAHDAVLYTLSAGYLLFPRQYRDYKQVNMNVYAELIGKSNPGYGQSYLDIAPSVQFIFNSYLRLDFSYRTPLYNNMLRISQNNYLVRLEYNLFNVL